MSGKSGEPLSKSGERFLAFRVVRVLAYRAECVGSCAQVQQTGRDTDWSDMTDQFVLAVWPPPGLDDPKLYSYAIQQRGEAP